MNILFKGDPDLIPKLIKEGFKSFELYIRNSQDYNCSFSNTNLQALHFHYKLDDGRAINLADNGEIGDLSEDMLKKAIACAKRNNIPRIVFHPPNVNLLKVNRQEAIQTMARRLKRAYDPEVQLCIENVALWINQLYTNQPLFVFPEEFFEISKEVKIPLGLTLDVEHFCITSVMKIFYDDYLEDFKKFNTGLTNFEDIRQRFEKQLKQYCQQNDMAQHCHNFIVQSFLKLINHANHIHACGSDFTQYFANSSTLWPTLGEHLPLGFNGVVEGAEVKDKINHRKWLEIVQDKNLDVVLEVSPKGNYDFMESLKNSNEHLQLCQDTK